MAIKRELDPSKILKKRVFWIKILEGISLPFECYLLETKKNEKGVKCVRSWSKKSLEHLRESDKVSKRGLQKFLYSLDNATLSRKRHFHEIKLITLQIRENETFMKTEN